MLSATPVVGMQHSFEVPEKPVAGASLSGDLTSVNPRSSTSSPIEHQAAGDEFHARVPTLQRRNHGDKIFHAPLVSSAKLAQQSRERLLHAGDHDGAEQRASGYRGRRRY
jgi:hypothetical protein